MVRSELEKSLVSCEKEKVKRHYQILPISLGKTSRSGGILAERVKNSRIIVLTKRSRI
jgi:hypothetical protein